MYNCVSYEIVYSLFFFVLKRCLKSLYVYVFILFQKKYQVLKVNIFNIVDKV